MKTVAFVLHIWSETPAEVFTGGEEKKAFERWTKRW